MAQDMTQMNFANGTISAGGCQITGITNLTIANGQISGTGSTIAFSGTCSGQSQGGGTTENVTITPNASVNFVIGTTQVAPAATIGSTDSGVSCTFTGSDSTTYTGTAGQTVTLTTPTVAGTTNYNVSCRTSTANITAVTAVPNAVSVVATTNTQGGGTGINSCSATQSSTSIGGVILQRQCTGGVAFGNNYHPAYVGPNLYRLDVAFADKLHPGPFPNLISGYSMVMSINKGSYVSLAFNATNSGQMQFTADPSYGEAGVISISRRPGVFSLTDPDIVSGTYGACVYNNSGSNSMWIGMGADCPLIKGQDYYVNFADVDGVSGQPIGIGRVSYSVVAGH